MSMNGLKCLLLQAASWSDLSEPGLLTCILEPDYYYLAGHTAELVFRKEAGYSP